MKRVDSLEKKRCGDHFIIDGATWRSTTQRLSFSHANCSLFKERQILMESN
jgi:hypothetical protein